MNKEENRLKPALATTLLMVAMILGISPSVSAECGDLDDRCTYPDPNDGVIEPGGTVDCATHDPGQPGSGQLDATMWYVGQNVYLACGFMDGTEDAFLLHGGNLAWKMGLVASGGADLFDTTNFVPAALVYHGTAEDAATSQAQDSCAALLGDENPNCGEDADVPQDLQCPGGAEIPNPVGGGLVGDTLDNSNGALQATCILVAAWNQGAPNETQVMEYSDDVQAILFGLNGDVFAFASDATAAFCTYLAGDPSCV